MKYALAILAGLMATSAEAQTRMKDYSLSPEESLKQPNISGSMPSNYDGYKEQQQPQNSGGSYNNTMPATPSNSFMVGFCDPNFKPVASGAVQACVEQKRQQSCREFSQLTSDVQSVLDRSIGCAYAASNDPSNGLGDAACATENATRLHTLKNHSNNNAASHALIYMQDDILNAGATCMGGR